MFKCIIAKGKKLHIVLYFYCMKNTNFIYPIPFHIYDMVNEVVTKSIV